METTSSVVVEPLRGSSQGREPRPGFGRGRRGGPRGGRGRGLAPRPNQIPNHASGREQRQARAGGGQGRERAAQRQPRMVQDVRNDPNLYQPEVQERPVPLKAHMKGLDMNATAAPDEEAVDDADTLCFICASEVVHHSVSPCNHRTCHICSLRLRALYKTSNCPNCRTPATYVIFTDEAEKRYEEYDETVFEKSDDNLGIKYEKNDIFEDTVLLLRYNCPEASCDVACYGWPDLHRHVKSVHQKVMCDLCTRNKKVFTHEHELFTPATLRKHERYGDDNPGAVDQSGFKGHPECGFCRQRFYGDDELYAHCRDKHERCHVCDRADAVHGRQHNHQQYYVDYDSLEIHFSKDHFLCPDKECLEKKFVVFSNEMDLKAHQLEAHPNGLTKDARRDARKVDMSGFDYRSPHNQEPRSRRREDRGRGRGQDPNVDTGPLPTSSAQPLRRDEVAYQRSLAIHSAQSVSNRVFGGQLTSNNAMTARPPANTQAPATVSAPRSVSSQTTTHATPTSTNGTTAPIPTDTTTSLDLTSTSDPVSAPPTHLQTQTDRARALRHASILERASKLSRQSPQTLSLFRQNITSFKNSSQDARQLITTFFSLFSCPASELVTLIKELADAFEVPGKREELMAAWNDWKAIHEDYPSLPGGVSNNADVTTGLGGKRILKLKSSTAQSSRSAVSRHGSWGRAGASAPAATSSAGNASSRSEAYPGLPASTAASANRSGAGRVAPVPWVKPSASVSSPALRPTSVAHPSAAASSSRTKMRNGTGNAGDAFPALPAAPKLGMNISRPGYAGNPVRRGEGNAGNSANVSAWGPAIVQDGLGGMESKVDGVDAGGKGKGEETDLDTLGLNPERTACTYGVRWE